MGEVLWTYRVLPTSPVDLEVKVRGIMVVFTDICQSKYATIEGMYKLRSGEVKVVFRGHSGQRFVRLLSEDEVQAYYVEAMRRCKQFIAMLLGGV